jgi:D-3-phosphoglycerate dehydrogenase
MPHILVAGRIHPSGVALLERASGVTFDLVEDNAADAFHPHLPSAEAIVIRTQPLTAALIDRAPRLRIVSRHGVGYDSVDLAALEARGIPLAIAGNANARAVAEHAMALILAAAKRLLPSDRAVRRGDWEARAHLAPREIGGRRLLVLGYGRTGRLVAGYAAAFGMAIDVHDPFVDAVEPPARLEPDLHAALARADVVSIHVPKGRAPVLGAAEFAAMKPGLILVNTARGGVADEAALAQALRARRIAAAGLDVFEEEPPPADHPLLTVGETILTPHLAGVTEEAAERMAVVSVRNVLDFFAGRLDPAMVVNPAALGRAAAG